MKAAMKSGDRVVLSTLRLLLSALHNEEIKLHRELSTEEIQKTVATLCKQRQESIEFFRKRGRTDLLRQAETELRGLRGFLPAALSEEEVRAAIQSSIEEVGAKGIQDLGRGMNP